MRQRADLLLVERGFFPTRARAQAAIAAGLVTADGLPVRKASDRVETGALIGAEAAHPYVSRGGVKLAAGLDAFGFDPAGRICLDLGASAGGFADVLLRRGAVRVYAVDVGHGQLHPSLAGDPRIVHLEGLDGRSLDAGHVPDPIALLVADVSFISLKLALPPAVALLAPGGALVALVKPQFEAGRAAARKGVVRDPAVHEAVCADLAAFAAELGLTVVGLVPSPIDGGDGNREFLIGARRG
jgi:23S rRNA (cytidine1920-2'-O)/16S rRNA (cytidine1409-2'-O)-methyltransferase